MRRKAAVLLGLLFLVPFLLSATPSGGKGKKEQEEKDPYMEISSDLSSLAGSISQKNTGEKNGVVKASGKDDDTDYLFNVYKVWEDIIDMELIKGAFVDTWYNELQKTGIYKGLFLAIIVIEIAILFFSGELDLGTLLKTLFYSTAVYIIAVHNTGLLQTNYKDIFFALDHAFNKISLLGINSKEWDTATHALIDVLFAAVNPFKNPLGGLFLLPAFFAYLFLYFVYLPAVTLPIIISNLLIFGLFILGRFALIFSILSVFRKFALSLITSFVAIEFYKGVFIHLVAAIGFSVSQSGVLHPGFWAKITGWASLKIILYAGPIAALFIALDIVSLNIIRSVFSTIFFPAKGGGTTA